MAHSTWSGHIAFGLVSVPVAMYTATREHNLRFHEFERGTTDRIRIRRVNERTGKEVDRRDIVKGRDDDGEVVLLEQEELDSVAPGGSQELSIEAFVDLDEIDPLHFRRAYWIGPRKEGAKPYALLVSAMRDQRRAAVGTFVMRGKQHLAAIREDNGVLALHTLYFADEVLDPSEQLPAIPEADVSAKERSMAESLIESMTEEWDPSTHRDTYAERVEKLVEDKSRGRKPSAEASGRTAEVTDLMDALQRSVQAGRRGKGKASPRRTDLSELTKTELGEMARRLQIPGRSKMKRAELEEAVAAADVEGESRAS